MGGVVALSAWRTRAGGLGVVVGPVVQADLARERLARLVGQLDGYRVLEPSASNGEEALQAMKAQRYDLVLMDCEMPVLDGFSATEQLRAWEVSHQRVRTPVVALTAHILTEHKERARQAGMDGHMAKPVELSQLRELVEYWVVQRELRQSQAQPS